MSVKEPSRSKPRPAQLAGDRPKRGIGPDPALKRWSDAAAYSALVELSGQTDPPAEQDSHRFIRDEERCRTYNAKREAIEVAFIGKLVDGEIFGSGIAPGRRREVIHPSIWELLTIDYALFGDAVGENRKYEKLEFFELPAIPQNVWDIPDWLADKPAMPSPAAFTHSSDYRHATLGGIKFVFGSIQANVIKVLHQAALTPDCWRDGKAILKDAGSKQLKVVDVFKSKIHWRDLIESDGRGKYRLRID